MEILAIAFATVIGLLAIAAWVHVRIEQYKIQYGNPQEIEELKTELKRQAEIVNRLDADGLEHVKKRADEIAGQLKDIKVGQLLGGRR